MTSVAVLGPFCAFMSSVTWAFGSSGYSKIARDHSAFSVNFGRSLVALPLFLVMAVLTAGADGFKTLDWGHTGWLILSMVASYGIGDSIFMMASSAIGIPAALTIASSYPLLTATLGVVVHHEWLTLSQVIGLVLTMAGVACVILTAPRLDRETPEDGVDQDVKPYPDQAPAIRVNRTTGILFAFGSAICWATNSYSVSRGGQDISPAVGNTVRMLTALIVCAVIGKLVYPRSKMVLPGHVFKKWMWLFVFEAFGGSLFYIYGLSHSPLAIGPTLASLAPVLSVPVALALRLEKFSWKRTASVITVVFGLFLLVGGLNG